MEPEREQTPRGEGHFWVDDLGGVHGDIEAWTLATLRQLNPTDPADRDWLIDPARFFTLYPSQFVIRKVINSPDSYAPFIRVMGWTAYALHPDIRPYVNRGEFSRMYADEPPLSEFRSRVQLVREYLKQFADTPMIASDNRTLTVMHWLLRGSRTYDRVSDHVVRLEFATCGAEVILSERYLDDVSKRVRAHIESGDIFEGVKKLARQAMVRELGGGEAGFIRTNRAVPNATSDDQNGGPRQISRIVSYDRDDRRLRRATGSMLAGDFTVRHAVRSHLIMSHDLPQKEAASALLAEMNDPVQGCGASHALWYAAERQAFGDVPTNKRESDAHRKRLSRMRKSAREWARNHNIDVNKIMDWR